MKIEDLVEEISDAPADTVSTLSQKCWLQMSVCRKEACKAPATAEHLDNLEAVTDAASGCDASGIKNAEGGLTVPSLRSAFLSWASDVFKRVASKDHRHWYTEFDKRIAEMRDLWANEETTIAFYSRNICSLILLFFHLLLVQISVLF